MAVNINQLTPDNSTLILIDHQPFVALPIESHSRLAIEQAVVGLARSAKALGVPTILTTISGRNGALADPLFKALQAVHPDVEPIDRTNTNAWSDSAFVEAVAATGRTKLVMAGLWTEVCLAQTALSAMADGFDVFFVSDASGGLTREGHEDAKTRMVQAGAHPLTWMATVAEWSPDNTTPEYQSLYPVTVDHAGGLGVAVEYVLAQIESGRIELGPSGAPGRTADDAA